MNPGNLIFVIHEIPHPVFKREKNDLHTNLVISLKEALLGFKKQITHLDGHQVTIKKEGVVQPGDVIKIKEEGMPVHQTSEKGDLYVKIEIKFPELLTEKQKESKILIFK
jgi:DnaJ family protein B protein 11